MSYLVLHDGNLSLSSSSGIFNDSFIDHLFDLVEQTRGMHDETFNYSVIKLIVSLVALIRATHIHFEPLGFPQRAVHGRLAKWRFQCTTCTK